MGIFHITIVVVVTQVYTVVGLDLEQMHLTDGNDFSIEVIFKEASTQGIRLGDVLRASAIYFSTPHPEFSRSVFWFMSDATL